MAKPSSACVLFIGILGRTISLDYFPHTTLTNTLIQSFAITWLIRKSISKWTAVETDSRMNWRFENCFVEVLGVSLKRAWQTVWASSSFRWTFIFFHLPQPKHVNNSRPQTTSRCSHFMIDIHNDLWIFRWGIVVQSSISSQFQLHRPWVKGIHDLLVLYRLLHHSQKLTIHNKIVCVWLFPCYESWPDKTSSN
jgi:hypothetical protein